MRGACGAGLWPTAPGHYEYSGRGGPARPRHSMDLLRELLAPRGIRLTVAVYPWPDQVRRGDLQSLQASFWRQWAADRGAGFLDYFPRFVDVARTREVLAREFIPRAIHCNVAGHQG